MSEVSLFKLWERGAMESCYKLYTWINHTLLMLLLQIFWKMSQISDYFKRKSVEDLKSQRGSAPSPLTKSSKMRRHIRSMSDVHYSTPYRIPFRLRKGSVQTLMYDSDTRAKRISAYRGRYESTDSSDNAETPTKLRSLEKNILKHTDSMRVL